MISLKSKCKRKVIPAMIAGNQQDRVISIEFPENTLRARKVISRSNAKATGKWPSWKIGRMMHYESGNERNAFKLLDACPEVISYREQPCIVRYVLDGVEHRHYPDIQVNFKAQQHLWEVKTEAESNKPDTFSRSELMAKCLPAFGFGYHVALAENLKRNPRLRNIEILLRHRRSPVPINEYEQIRQLFKKHENLHWGYFQHGEAGATYLKSICQLIVEGHLAIDVNEAIQAATLIQINHNNDGGQLWQSLIS